jgi:septum formation protein
LSTIQAAALNTQLKPPDRQELKIILASTSEIRRQILANAGVAFDVRDPGIDETAEKNQNTDPESLAIALAKLKSEKVSRQFPDAIAIGCDQTLGFQNRIFGKPDSIAAARRQLRDLRGNSHWLCSAVSCSANGKQIWSALSKAELAMRNFSDDFLERYLNGDAANYLGSVGGYKIETAGIQLFERVDGDHFAILGLPLLPLLEFLRRREAIPA